MPLASFYTCIAEIIATYLGYCIIVVAPLITNETSQIEFISWDFFLLCYNLTEGAEELCDVMAIHFFFLHVSS